jgi:anti-sigma B factor antagonist
MIEIENRTVEQGAVIAVRGQVDMSTSPALRRALQERVATQAALLVVNLTEVGYIDSSGVATLVETLKETSRYGGRLRLCGMNDTLRGVFEMSRLESIFDIRDTEEQALA